jgi:hypothetical protein
MRPMQMTGAVIGKPVKLLTATNWRAMGLQGPPAVMSRDDLERVRRDLGLGKSLDEHKRWLAKHQAHARSGLAPVRAQIDRARQQFAQYRTAEHRKWLAEQRGPASFASWTTAVHEAAHIVIGDERGVGIRRATIKATDQFAGQAVFNPHGPSAEDWLCIDLAGAVAEAIEEGQDPRSAHPSGSDAADALTQVLVMTNMKACADMTATAEYRAAHSAVVETLRRRWRAVQRVAKALLIEQELDRDDLKKLLN